MESADFERLLAGSDEVIPLEDLKSKLAESRPLRVKLGIDPSRPDLHLGHAVVLRKLRQFQELGHIAVLIIGDFTGRVGDPSGQSETRPMLSADELEANAATYLEQAGLVLEIDKAEVHRNSEWLEGMGMDEVLRLTSSFTVARMLERDDFELRLKEQRPISVVEFLYPLMQAMDSVQIKADVEMGGTDQKFNLLVGRDIQREYGQNPQVVFTMPLLEGTDGRRKMSKSYDNYVGLTDSADEMFGRLMRIPDELIDKYALLCEGLGPAELSGDKPVERKRALSGAIVDLYHGEGAGKQAEERFNTVHKEHEIPDDVPDGVLPDEDPVFLPRLLSDLGLASSNGEGRRLISQGGVRLEGAPVDQEEMGRDRLIGKVLQVGRRKFVRLV
jgi:tyrosyl-tRNA synthetase